MAKSVTGGRPVDGRDADQTAHHMNWSGTTTLPERVVAVSPEAEPDEAAMTRGLRRFFHGCRMMFYVVTPLVLLTAIGIGVLYVRLRHGPIGFDFVVAPIERGINAELTTSSVKIDGAELRLGTSGELEFRLRDVSVLEKGGDVVLSSPLAAVNISLAALMRGRIVPRRIELIDPIIALAYSEDAGFVFERAIPHPVPARAPNQGTPATAPSQDNTVAPNTTVAVRTVRTGHQINLARMLSDSSYRARQRLDATSYLTEFGLSNATVVVDYEGQRSSWRIDEASVDFNHQRKRSVISGRALVASKQGPWAFSFLTDEREAADKLEVKATVRDLVPSTLAAAAPPLALLGMFEFPVAADATVVLTRSGDIENGDLSLEFGKGRARLPYLVQPMDVTAGLFKLDYDGKKRRWDLQPSPVKWADGTIMFSGAMMDVAKANEPPQWRFALDGKKGVFEAPEFDVPPVTIDSWTAHGSIIPRRGQVDIDEFRLAGGGGVATVKATTQAGPQGQSMSAEFSVSPMPLKTLKALWPRALATGTREWVGKNLSAVDFQGGTLSFTNGNVGGVEAGTVLTDLEHVTASFEAKNLVFHPLPGMPEVEAPETSVKLTDNAIEIAMPRAETTLADGQRLALKDISVRTNNVMAPRPDGEISLSASGDLGPFIEAVQALPIRNLRDAPQLPKAGEGKVNAQFDIKVPFVPNVTGDDIAVTGKARITDGRFGKVAGRFDVQGFTLNLDLSDTALDAKGDLLVNGVPAKIAGQRLLGPGAGQQPPIKIMAKLDDADRTQLGLDINDIVQGVVPIEVSLEPVANGPLAIKLHADLTNADMALDHLQWHKAAGHTATVDADIASNPNHDTELQNFKITSDDIAAEGKIVFGPDNKIKQFEFPNLMLNVVSNLDIKGSRGKDDMWSIDASGKNFDGRNFFRSMFNIGNGPERKADLPGAAKGGRVNAQIDNVIGGYDVSLRNVKMQIETRGGNLTALNVKGTLDGGAPLAAEVDKSSGTRRLLVDSPDAGQVMKLVNFYPNMQGGRMRLEVNLDGTGPAEKTGILWVEDFKILGDPIVSEVVSSADQGRPAIEGRRNVTREVFEFDGMRAPFSVGYGQFVLEEAYLKGPLLGANLRGKVDFKTKRVNFGGTYIPLQGLNGALGGIPLLGQIISGTQGEGIFGITFAVQGPTSNPQVIVNPLSLVAPGIFREMFQMTASDPKVQIRGDDRPSQASTAARVRETAPDRPTTGQNAKSKATANVKAKPKPKPKKPVEAQAGAVDGWSSTTTQPSQ
ncbi:hypothetical protein HYPDE_35383 [Hyphomicrobium denitrificans 1NES1]|uniref:DUF3971 domain-containing protein n=1 Tax=Hyphomicrobium denitrificans 1NES1 TaxID=670307 RepID=N0B6U7_9HYPH|nr:AsmA-like C-terminal region-containing protein [Hyphomicrobium denitrificans]AGK58748.1 hypothetical protein HYPDE_35383 [Hyphomicrobium denitrificans 1NES1]